MNIGYSITDSGIAFILSGGFTEQRKNLEPLGERRVETPRPPIGFNKYK
jgi:hypothetical protein